MATIYCNKKICKHNRACCVNAKEMFECGNDTIIINDEVECDYFEADYNKIKECNKCLKKKGLVTIDVVPNRNIKLKVEQSSIKDYKDFLK